MHVLVFWVGRGAGERRSLPVSGKDFYLLVSISVDKMCFPFPVSIPLDKVSGPYRSKYNSQQDLLSALPRSWVDISLASDTEVIA